MYGIFSNSGIPSENFNTHQMSTYMDTLAIERHVQRLRESIDASVREQHITCPKNLGKWNIQIPDNKFSNFSRPLSFSK